MSVLNHMSVKLQLVMLEDVDQTFRDCLLVT